MIIMEEKHKTICITIGVNMTRVLKYLNKFERSISFNELFNGLKEHEKYPLGLFLILVRLMNRKMINVSSDGRFAYNEYAFHQREYNENMYKFEYLYFAINNKGKLLLELLREIKNS